ncbi:peptidase M43 pregnancy-associated plasma-A protein [Rutstroemia sp. NJR-2017a BVV2]|nr:peptidase M43 pregnancy-associated plasma-A protein [Rutstroemia sp. NJR-2017a BVV2]
MSDLAHLHVFRPSVKNLESTLRSVEGYLLYGGHGSGGREFGGTVVFGGEGGVGVGVEGKELGLGRPVVSVGWRGWLRVEREETAGFGAGMSAEEIVGRREARWEVVERKGWRAVADNSVGRGGEFRWKEE